MGKSTSGPEHADVMSMMQAIQAFTNGEVLFTAEVVERGWKTQYMLTFTLKAPKLVGAGEFLYLQASGEWPNVEGVGYEAFCYRLLQKIDAMYAEEFVQLPLPDTTPKV